MKVKINALELNLFIYNINLNNIDTPILIELMTAKYKFIKGQYCVFMEADTILYCINELLTNEIFIENKHLLNVCSRYYNKLKTKNSPTFGLLFNRDDLIPNVKAIRELFKSIEFEDRVPPDYLIDSSLKNCKDIIDNGIVVGPFTKEDAMYLLKIARNVKSNDRLSDITIVKNSKRYLF